jgi:hypothetical protein
MRSSARCCHGRRDVEWEGFKEPGILRHAADGSHGACDRSAVDGGEGRRLVDPKRSPTHPERCRFAGVPFVVDTKPRLVEQSPDGDAVDRTECSASPTL